MGTVSLPGGKTAEAWR